MTRATEHDIARSLDLRNPHVNAIVEELRHLRDVVEAVKPIMKRIEQGFERMDNESCLLCGHNPCTPRCARQVS